MSFRLLRLAGLGGLLAAVTACSSSGPVNDLSGTEASGTVTLDGKPLSGGLVIFASANDSASGTIRPDGTYLAVNLPVAPLKVGVNTQGAELNARGAGFATKQAKKAGGEEAHPGGVRPAPAKYRSPESSGLTFTPKAGPNTFDIKLTSK